MRNRLILLLLSLVVLAGAPGWAPAAFEARPQANVEHQRATAANIRLRAPDRVSSWAREPLTDYALHLPSGWETRQPLRILVALHGMGDKGTDFVQPLLPLAEKHGWAVLAPTMPYGDYRDPNAVRRDGLLLPRLKALIDVLPDRTGVAFEPQVLFYGFSRGSQEAHRFSFMYPEATLGVAGMSAGSYTLPLRSMVQRGASAALKYPFGIQDVDQICGRVFDSEAAQRVQYWIAVGSGDTRVEDVPRQWDFLGSNRVERAQGFVNTLKQFGAQAKLTVFPGAKHEVTDAMRSGAIEFLASLQPQDGRARLRTLAPSGV